MIRWLLYIVVAIVALVGVVAIIGAFLPKGHRATRSAVYRATPGAVFAVITDVERFAQWRPSVRSVELLPDVEGKRVFKEVGRNDAITYRVDEIVPDRRLVTRIADPSLPFGGTWTFDLQPTGTGTTVTITEDGEVYNVIFRFISKTVFSPTATIEQYLADLKRRLGE
jgi:uncharacterized protein YndB with AHSA1/START domain